MCWLDNVSEEAKKQTENKTELRFCHHYGGGWKVSVTSGIWCVDLRRFYLNKEGEEKPSRHGIGLRLVEWEKLMDIVNQIRVDFPDLYIHNTCNHQLLDDWMNCSECLPFVPRNA